MEKEKRLIDSEAIARKLKNAHCAECNVVRKVQCSACWVNDVLELLDGNTVDAVEVVRCKDCRWRNTKGCPYKNFKAAERDDDDFCSDGERRTNG